MRGVMISVVLALSLFAAPNALGADSLLFPSRDRSYRALWAFQSLCLAHRLDREGALKAADAQGWQVLPDGEKPIVGGVQDVLRGMKANVVSAGWKPSSDGDMVLLFSRQAGSPDDHCAVAFHSGFRMASSVLGGSEMAPLRRFEKISPKYDLWAFVEDNGRRRDIRGRGGRVDEAMVAKALEQRRFATIVVIGSDTDESTLFSYSAPSPKEAAPLPSPSAAAPIVEVPDPAICQAARDVYEAEKAGNPTDPSLLKGVHRFRRQDGNCDGRITLEEYVEAEWRESLWMDLDRDGVISRAEFLKPFCDGRLWQAHDGGVSLCEKSFSRTFARYAGPFGRSVTQASHRRATTGFFRAHDRSRDGVLTPGQLRLYD